MNNDSKLRKNIIGVALLVAVIFCGGVLFYSAGYDYKTVINMTAEKMSPVIHAPDKMVTTIGADDFSIKEENEDLVVSYTSNNPDVVEVDEDGTVTVKGKGNAIITAFSNGGLYYQPTYSKIEVQVNAVDAPTITDSTPGIRTTAVQWNAVKNADGYYVNEYDSEGKLINTDKLKADQTFVEYRKSAAGQTFSYDVVAFAKIDGEEYKGEPSEKVTEETRNALLGQGCETETGGRTGGKAGDQTGKEICIRGWSYNSRASAYNHWGYVARFKDPEKARAAAAAMEAACANPHIGYDKGNRTDIYQYAVAADWDLGAIDTNCECSCSPLVAACVNAAGVEVPISWWTSNKSMRSIMEATGEFEFYTGPGYTSSQEKLQRGDIMVTINHHSGMAL